MFELSTSVGPIGLAALLAVGLVAGVINAMAGGGGFLMLPMMMAVGLPAGVANGTMRIAVFAQSAASAATFHRREVRDYGVLARLLLPIALGSGLGAWLATIISDELLKPVFGAVLLGWALLLWLRPSTFEDPQEDPRPPTAITYLLGVGIGIYGGFMQAGVGFPLLALTVTHLRYSPVRANAIKMLITGGYTLVVLPVFAMAGQVAWVEGLVLALGSMAGAYLGTRWQIAQGGKVVRYFVLGAVSVSGLAMIGGALWPYVAPTLVPMLPPWLAS